ncbi:MAG: MBL fold metallo-hydrolase [Planctomycetota bacterium]|nr:MBL fold metallo-hydrolase [Planctomycetota bacterium]
MQIHTLGSGSTGNCALISAGQGCSQTVICLDAGLALRTARGYAEELGFSMSRLDAVLLSHRHSDHSTNIVATAARAKAPLYMHEDNINANSKLQQSELNRRSIDWRKIKDGLTFQVNDVAVTAIEVEHDAVPTFGFVFEYQEYRCGFFTDLGNCDNLIANGVLADLDELVLESNYDPQMLANGPYPQALKQRVSARHGHLSNQQAAAAIADGATSRLKKLTLAHLSQKNNAPIIARECMLETLAACGLEQVELHTAPARGPLSPTRCI